MLDKIKSANTINTSTVLPIIDKTIRVTAKDGLVSVQATRLDQWYAGSGAGRYADMDVVLDGMKLQSAYQLLGEDLQAVKEASTVLLSSPKGKVRIQFEDAGAFPELQKPGEMIVTDMDVAANMTWACSKDELRPALTGVFVGKDMVATDAQRMVVVHGVEGPGVILPPDVLKWRGGLNISSDKRYAFIIGEDYFYGSLLIDAKYVPYDTVIGERKTTPITIGKEVVKLLHEKTVAESGQVKLSSGMITVHNAEKNIDMELMAPIETDHQIWFNPKLLADVLAWVGLDEMPFTLDKGNPSARAMVYTDGKRTAMIMPTVGL